MKKGNISIRNIILLLASLFFIFSIDFVSSVEPFGANITASTPQRAGNDAAQSVPAQAGNVTELIITGYSVTQSWQGYFGNVTGVIQLADANDNTLYNWSLASPQGEIYASLNGSINWNSIQCFNFTANGTAGAGNVAGQANLNGVNLSVLESQFNIESDDVDGVNETFIFKDHDEFFTANLQFETNECRSARIFGNGGQTQDGQFEEVLLYDYSNGGIIFTSLLEQDLVGFDAGTHDFEMLVLEDGHNANVAASTYYFYVELE